MFGIRIGQGALNECAAWLLDSSERSRGFSRVPPTAQAATEHSVFYSAAEAKAGSQFRMLKAKVGSLQRFETSIGCAEDFGPSNPNHNPNPSPSPNPNPNANPNPKPNPNQDFGPVAFSTLAVQRIALLDIRLFNLDRHGGNMLAQRAGTCEAEPDAGGPGVGLGVPDVR